MELLSSLKVIVWWVFIFFWFFVGFEIRKILIIDKNLSLIFFNIILIDEINLIIILFICDLIRIIGNSY